MSTTLVFTQNSYTNSCMGPKEQKLTDKQQILQESNNQWYIHTIKYCSLMKRNEVLISNYENTWRKHVLKVYCNLKGANLKKLETVWFWVYEGLQVLPLAGYKGPCWCYVTSVVSNSVRPHRRQPTRLLCPWESPGKNTGAGCHFFFQCMHGC